MKMRVDSRWSFFFPPFPTPCARDVAMRAFMSTNRDIQVDIQVDIQYDIDLLCVQHRELFL